jgi:hypothetical protein
MVEESSGQATCAWIVAGNVLPSLCKQIIGRIRFRSSWLLTACHPPFPVNRFLSPFDPGLTQREIDAGERVNTSRNADLVHSA